MSRDIILPSVKVMIMLAGEDISFLTREEIDEGNHIIREAREGRLSTTPTSFQLNLFTGMLAAYKLYPDIDILAKPTNAVRNTMFDMGIANISSVNIDSIVDVKAAICKFGTTVKSAPDTIACSAVEAFIREVMRDENILCNLPALRNCFQEAVFGVFTDKCGLPARVDELIDMVLRRDDRSERDVVAARVLSRVANALALPVTGESYIELLRVTPITDLRIGKNSIEKSEETTMSRDHLLGSVKTMTKLAEGDINFLSREERSDGQKIINEGMEGRILIAPTMSEFNLITGLFAVYNMPPAHKDVVTVVSNIKDTMRSDPVLQIKLMDIERVADIKTAICEFCVTTPDEDGPFTSDVVKDFIMAIFRDETILCNKAALRSCFKDVVLKGTSPDTTLEERVGVLMSAATLYGAELSVRTCRAISLIQRVVEYLDIVVVEHFIPAEELHKETVRTDNDIVADMTKLAVELQKNHGKATADAALKLIKANLELMEVSGMYALINNSR